MKYEALIKDLQYLAKVYSICENENTQEYKLAVKAADAIKELNEYANTMRKLKCEGWYLQQSKFSDGCQALTTMPLPEPPMEE